MVDDLFFSVKITDAAKRNSLPVDFVKSEKDALEKAAQHPVLIILDLNAKSLDPLEFATKLKSDPALKSISVVAYLSHVQGELKQRAHNAGIDIVLPRSAFSQNLVQILKRHSEHS